MSSLKLLSQPSFAKKSQVDFSAYSIRCIFVIKRLKILNKTLDDYCYTWLFIARLNLFKKMEVYEAW